MSLAQVMKRFKRNPEDPSYTPAVAIALQREKNQCKESSLKVLERQGCDAESDEGAELLTAMSASCVRNAVVMNSVLSQCPSIKSEVL